jgi:predicted RNase H-like HicB family nuclease
MKTYIFQVEFAQEEDGRWSTWIEALPGCTAWGYTREKALAAIKDAAEAYVEDVIEAGEELPKEGVSIVEAPVVTITR